MLNFEKLILHNFGSYQHTEINLQNKGFCLVTGQNHFKKDNALSNGSGKSFLWNAICFALVGETINGLHTNLKNINIVDDPDCFVELSFQNDVDHYIITRYVTPKSDLKIIKNNIDISGKGIRESEKKLTELLPELTKNLITSTIIIGQGMPNKFSSFSPSGRKELLEKLTKADFMIEDIKRRVTERQGILSQQIRAIEDQLLINRSQLSVFESNLRTNEATLAGMQKPDFEAQIKAHIDTIEQTKQIINAQVETLAGIQKEQTEVDTALLTANQSLATALAEVHAKYDQTSHDLVQRQAQLQAEADSLRREISRIKAIKDICPTCGQRIPGAVKPDTSGQEAQLQILVDQLAQAKMELHKLQDAEREDQKRVNSEHSALLNDLNTRNNKLKSFIADFARERRDLESHIAQEQEACNRLVYERDTWDVRYQQLYRAVLDNKAAIEKATMTIAEADAAREELAEHCKLVKKMDGLSKRDFRGFLLSNIISYINKKAKDYCEVVFNTRDLEVALDGNDLNISYCGKMFDNLSGGEKQRVDLILQFTIRNMLTAYLNFNSNILVLDEITDFLDKKSCTAILELITRELNTIESVFIVSHHASELELPIDSELVIQKNEIGISEILVGA